MAWTTAGIASTPVHEAGIAVDLRDGVPVLTVHGEHDLANAALLRDGLARAIAHGPTVVVDLSDASFIDSSVLHALAGASGPARGTIVVCPRAERLTRRLLHLSGLQDVVRIAETVEEALGLAAAEPAN
jgi:anti-sigma B factor antagonist